MRVGLKRLPVLQTLWDKEPFARKPAPFIKLSAAVRSLPSAIPTVIMKCFFGPRPGGGARFTGIVHHTDPEREWSYDRTSSIGKLDKALDDARANGWTVMDMKKDWKRIFAFDK